MAMDRNRRRVLVNDDGWIMGQAEPPLTADDLRRKMVATYEGTPVGVLLWSVGGHEVYEYETDVGERFGEVWEGLDDPRARNLRHLIDECGGPVTALTELCHEADIEFFPSVRMNQHYDIDMASPSCGRLRREHPELLIGRPGEEIPQETIDWGIRTGLNYAFPQVRAHMAAISIELVERFDVDGIELDFFRHPAFFRTDEAYGNRYLATDLVRTVKRRIEEINAEQGRRVELAVRVPATPADSARIGLDAGSWIADGLVDIVIAGGGFVPFETRVDQFVDMAGGTDCQIYGCIERLRPVESDDMFMAIASRYWDAGASGIYLFNYHGQPPEWKRSALNRIGDPGSLERVDKRYQMDNFTRRGATSQIGYAFRNAIAITQLPVALEETVSGSAAVLRFTITDDVEAAIADGVLNSCTLVLGMENGLPGDSLDVRLNDGLVDWESRTETDEAGTFELEVGCPPLRQGENEVRVRLLGRGPATAEGLVLKKLEVVLSYL